MIEKPTGAAPKVIDGITFRCWHVGIMKTEWRSEDGRLTAASAWNLASYAASVDGQYIRTGKKSKRFRTLENAMKAAVSAGMRGEP